MKNVMVQLASLNLYGLFSVKSIFMMIISSLYYAQAWCWYLEDVFLLHTPDEPDWVRPNHVIENEKNKALQLTPKQECDLINEQIKASEVCLLFLSGFS